MAIETYPTPILTGKAERDFLKKTDYFKDPLRDYKVPLREGFTAEERKELQYAVSITDYIREKGIII
jgi:hypothetical protein